MLKTAILHMLKNPRQSPERIARNIKELLGSCPLSHEELLSAIINSSPQECINWIMHKIS